MSYDLDKILPHRAPMVLLDEVLFSSPEKLVAKVNISEKSFGFEKDNVPGWFGVEYMAQAIAAYNGILAMTANAGGKPEIGFLVGVRTYKAHISSFDLGSELEVTVTPNFILDNSGTFNGSISLRGAMVAEALISTYKPDGKTLEKLRGLKSE